MFAVLSRQEDNTAATKEMLHSEIARVQTDISNLKLEMGFEFHKMRTDMDTVKSDIINAVEEIVKRRKSL